MSEESDLLSVKIEADKSSRKAFDRARQFAQNLLGTLAFNEPIEQDDRITSTDIILAARGAEDTNEAIRLTHELLDKALGKDFKIVVQTQPISHHTTTTSSLHASRADDKISGSECVIRLTPLGR